MTLQVLAFVRSIRKVYAVERFVLLTVILFVATSAMGAGAGKKMYDEYVETGQIYAPVSYTHLTLPTKA